MERLRPEQEDHFVEETSITSWEYGQVSLTAGILSDSDSVLC